MVTPGQRREALHTLVSRRLPKAAATRFLGLSRAIARDTLEQPIKDTIRAEQIIEVSQQFPRFGY
jgi:hypothetical protein